MGTAPVGAQPTPCTSLGTNPGGAGTNSVVISPVTAPVLALFPNPTSANGSFSFPTSSRTNVYFGQMRVDHVFSAKDTFFARLTTDASDVDSPSTMAFTSFNGAAFPQYRGQATNRNEFATAAETHIFSPAVLNTVRLSFSRTNFLSGDYSPTQVNVPSLLQGAPDMGTVTVTGYSQIGFYNIEGPPDPYHIQNIYSLADDVFYNRGKHSLKFGTLINHYGQGLLVPVQALGAITYSSVANFLLGIPSSYSAQIPGSNNDRYFDYQTYGFYAQDDWHAARRFTVNLGVRYEFMTTISELNNKGYAIRDMATDATAVQGPVMRNRTLLNFSPRAGFAWDVFGNGHTAVRGGFGIYYDIANLGGAFVSNSDGTPPLVNKFTISNTTANAVIPLPFGFNPAE